jgi:RHS repeat-associated protein
LAFLGVALIIAPVWSANAQGVAIPYGDAALEQRMVDQFGIDLASGQQMVDFPGVSIGPESGGLSYGLTWIGQGRYNSNISLLSNVFSAVDVEGEIDQFGVGFERINVSLFRSRGRFIRFASGIVSENGDGSTLVRHSAQSYTYTTKDGVVAQLNGPVDNAVTTVTYPSGEIRTFHYASGRLRSVTNNLGYQLHFEYGIHDLPTKVTAINNAIDYCNPLATTCSGLTQTWPTITYAYPSCNYSPCLPSSATDAVGRVTQYTFSGYRLDAVRLPGGSGDTFAFEYFQDYAALSAENDPDPSRWILGSINDGAGTWEYEYEDAELTAVVVVVDPLENRTVHQHGGDGFVSQSIDPLGRATERLYSTWGDLVRVEFPEGNYIENTLDYRRNVVQTRRVAKPGSGLSDIVTSATYNEGPTASVCVNIRTCNQPATTTDERGNVTNYTYDSTHGGVLTVTAPDPDGAGPQVRPQTRYNYQAHTSRYLVAPGNWDPSGPIYRLIEVSNCATSSWSSTACAAGGADELRTVIAYPAPSVPNNLLPISTTVRAGDNSLVATVTTAYNSVGDAIAVDGPQSGSADTTRTRYDAGRRVVGVISPDPDGVGGNPHVATRTTYHANGQVSLVEQGTVADQTDGAWVAFTSLRSTSTTYDALARPVRTEGLTGAAVHSVVQTSYDVLGRVECVAVRMNSSVFSSLPSSACTHSTSGSDGPDRIERNTYDDVGQLEVVQRAYGTPLQYAYATYAYTSNGMADWVEDANGNRSDYSYDGLDRLVRLNFPSVTSGAHAANANDYEQYGYDAAGNRISLRLRSGETIAFSYDALNRETVLDVPGSSATDVYSSYDLLGRLVYARFASAGGQGVSFVHDIFGRLTSETTSGRTLGYQYDVAGNRTRVTWPDAFYVGYAYDVVGRLMQVRENGATSGAGLLAVYSYDTLGRRSAIARGNNSAASFSYDAASRLQSVSQDLTGGTNDQTLGFSYNRASQVVQSTATNASYQWTPAAFNHPYTPNGLNQYTSRAGVNFSYDARGNLTSDGSRTFSYDLENRLLSVSGAASFALAYDPMGRLAQTTASSVGTDYLYDGDRLVAEYDAGGTLLRRYVHGADVDEPLVWYEGSGTSDRRYLVSDHLGSVIASDGSSTVRYAYGPFGEPDAWTGGRFRFTGQIALPEAGLYHYKARAYDPVLGRFLQSDPIGYDAGDMNLYAYVGNDPFSALDPTGLAECRLSPEECNVLEADRQELLRAARRVSDLSRSTAARMREGADLTDEQKELADAFREHFGRNATPRVLDNLAHRIDRVREFWSDNGPATAVRADRRHGYSSDTAAYRLRREPAPNIYINGFVYFGIESQTTRASTLFHEGAHKVLGYTDYGDQGYAWHHDYRRLGIRQRWINADSIACYAVSPCN